MTTDGGQLAAGKSHLHRNGGIDDGQSVSGKSVATAMQATTSSSSKYERALIAELGALIHKRSEGATLAEMARPSLLMVSLRCALRVVFPSSPTRRSDKDLIAFDADIIMCGLKIAQGEQSKVTSKLVKEERYEAQARKGRARDADIQEIVNYPFGLYDCIQATSLAQDLDKLYPTLRRRRVGSNSVSSSMNPSEMFTFSQSVPAIVRSARERIITFAAFALGQQEVGQDFSAKKGGGLAAYVLDCVEECIAASAVSMRSGFSHMDELEVDKAVQIMANLHAFQCTLKRIFGTIARGLCHVGLVRGDNLEETFSYADKTLELSQRKCESEVSHMSSIVYDIVKNKVDSLLDYSLDTVNWVSCSTRDMPDVYVETITTYLRSTFSDLDPMDEKSRTGLQFSACGHVAERLVKLLIDRAGGAPTGNLSPISKMDAIGLENMNIDALAFEAFANETGVAQLGVCFNELRTLASAMIDRDLPLLLQPGNEKERRKKYPYLTLDKIGVILDKYVDIGLGEKMKSLSGSKSKKADVLMLEKKEVLHLIKLVKMQTQAMSSVK